MRLGTALGRFASHVDRLDLRKLHCGHAVSVFALLTLFLEFFERVHEIIERAHHLTQQRAHRRGHVFVIGHLLPGLFQGRPHAGRILEPGCHQFSAGLHHHPLHHSSFSLARWIDADLNRRTILCPEDARCFTELLGDNDHSDQFPPANTVERFLLGQRNYVNVFVLLERLDKLPGHLRFVFVHDRDLQRRTAAAKRARDQTKEHAHQHGKTNDEEHADPVPPHQRQVFDRHRENATHQSRKLLPVRVKKTLSKSGLVTSSVWNATPAEESRAISSNGCSVSNRSNIPSSGPGKIPASLGAR